MHWDSGTTYREFKCVCIQVGTPKAKATIHSITDTEARRRRYQIGLDTRVVYAVNDEY